VFACASKALSASLAFSVAAKAAMFGNSAPVGDDVQVEVDGEAMGARRERLLADVAIAFVILGAAGDLKDHFARLSEGKRVAQQVASRAASRVSTGNAMAASRARQLSVSR
jgi:hypothetical protein